MTGKYDLCSTVQETDGAPANIACLPINVPNGTVTDNTSSITLNYAGLPSGGLFTTGSIPFGNGTASLAQNNANLFWDDTNNRLGLGTTAPSQQLHLTGAAIIPSLAGGTGATSTLALRSTTGVGTTDAILFQVGNNGATEAMRITDAGNVGIGTTSVSNPASFTRMLQVSTAGSAAISLYDTAATAQQWDIAVNSKDFDLYDATAAAHRLVVKATTGNVGIGTTAPAALLHILGGGAIIDETLGVGTHITLREGAVNKYILESVNSDFYINDRTGVGVRTVTVKSGGNVGIGTTGPGAILHVVKSGTEQMIIGEGGVNGLHIRGASSSGGTHYNWLIGEQTSVNKGFEITPSTAVGGTTFSTPALTILADTGNVGIGTTGPQVPLQVNGRIAVNGNPVDAGPIIDVVGTYTPTSGNGIGIQIRPTLNPGANGSGYLFAGGGTINKAGSGTHAMFATYAGNPPTVGANAGSTLTNAAILYMTGTTAGATNNYALYSDSASNSYFAGNVGIGTTNPTHALTLPSTSSGLVLYSTADQTTNYGRLRLFNNGGIMTFVTDIAGTVGSGDINLRFQVGDGSNVRFLPNQFTFNPSAAGTAFTFGTGTIDGPLSLRPDVRTLAGTDANSPLTIGGFSQWAPTSGTAKYILEQTYFNPSSGAAKLIGHALEVPINQTGTATGDFTALHVNVTETAVTGTNKLLMDLQVGGTSQVRITDKARMYRSGGTAIATTDWALTSGWGANATISAVTGNDSRGTVTVTTSALDTPSANPVLTLTFKDLTWSSVPFCMVCMDHGSTGPSTVPATCQATATTLVVSYRGTPTATSALTYKVNFMVLG